MTTEKKLYQTHLERIVPNTLEHLTDLSFDHLIIDAGIENYWFNDDQTSPFVLNPQFNYFCPAEGFGHFLHLSQNEKPKVYFFTRPGFWYKQHQFEHDYWSEFFDVISVDSREEALKEISKLSRACYLGACQDTLPDNLEKNPEKVVAFMNWQRSYKTEYEIFCLDKASEIAATAHKAAENAFLMGKSELETHFEYLKAAKCREEDLPYPTIIGFNQNGAYLHYREKNLDQPGSTMLIDAGFKYRGYGSDITRTYVSRAGTQLPGFESVSEVGLSIFKGLLSKMETLQKDLCAQTVPGLSYGELHESCLQGTLKILIDAQIIKGISLEEANSKEMAKLFMPHGLGHLLGIQVHDVAGKQSDEEGHFYENYKHRFLRNLRPIEEGQVFTVEPGLYFIESVLREAKSNSEINSFIDFDLIEKVSPCGGIRIEDNLAILKNEAKNLTRPYLP